MSVSSSYEKRVGSADFGCLSNSELIINMAGLFTRDGWMSNEGPIEIESEREVYEMLRIGWQRECFIDRSELIQTTDPRVRGIAPSSRRADASKDGGGWRGGF